MDKPLVYYGVGFGTGVVVGTAIPLATVTFVGWRGWRRMTKKLGSHVTDDMRNQAMATVTSLIPKDSHLTPVPDIEDDEESSITPSDEATELELDKEIVTDGVHIGSDSGPEGS